MESTIGLIAPRALEEGALFSVCSSSTARDGLQELLLTVLEADGYIEARVAEGVRSGLEGGAIRG
jgi:hypothetical protein